MLSKIVAELQQAVSLQHKQDIQTAARQLGQWVPHPQTHEAIALGDDCAAIPQDDGYLLLAAEGLWPQLVQREPWFAGWCAVMVNVSDIYAMGGRPLAVVDALWSQTAENAAPLWEGMTAASRTFGVPIVGGHSNHHSPYDALAVAILGQATHLITSFNARPDDVLLVAVDLDGQAHPDYPFWNAATHKDGSTLRDNLALLPAIAERGWCDAGKDISMGGLIGTLLMLLETSGVGAWLDLGAVPCPRAVPLVRWLLSFPSYGFILSVRPEQVADVQALFRSRDLVCAAVGQVTSVPEPTSDRALTLRLGAESMPFWDLRRQALTGFARS
ncbi:MAG: sll0787 family AIR synthase-like protein [Elainellaceae cyanobacterium]